MLFIGEHGRAAGVSISRIEMLLKSESYRLGSAGGDEGPEPRSAPHRLHHNLPPLQHFNNTQECVSVSMPWDQHVIKVGDRESPHSGIDPL